MRYTASVRDTMSEAAANPLPIAATDSSFVSDLRVLHEQGLLTVENLSLEVAFARYGAQATNKQRSLSALARDGSLVLSCESLHFTRPGMGILRYSRRLSELTGAKPRIIELRTQLEAAFGAGTNVRPVVITAPKGLMKRVIHVRSDLEGRVVEFDGDTFSIDFTRPAPPVEEIKVKRRNKR